MAMFFCDAELTVAAVHVGGYSVEVSRSETLDCYMKVALNGC